MMTGVRQGMRQVGWMTRVRVAMLIAMSCTVAACGAATPAHAQTPASGLGINGFYLFWSMPQSTWASNVASMAADGIKVVRADAFWTSVEPTAPTSAGPTYNWSTTDAIMSVLAQNGIQWLPIIDYTTYWNESVAGDDESAPADPGAYATYAAAFVARYGPDGSFWESNPNLPYEPVKAVEIWNEPNVAGTGMAASTYATMYEDARTAIHAVNTSVEVIVGGLADPAADYVEGMQQTIGPGKLDAVAIHPYDKSPTAILNDVNALRSALNSNGDSSAPIDVTEFGWPISGTASWAPTLSQSERGSYLNSTVSMLANSGDDVERIMPYAWVTQAQNVLDPNQWFGITANGAATDSSNELATIYKSLEAGQGVAAQSIPASAATALATPLMRVLAAVQEGRTVSTSAASIKSKTAAKQTQAKSAKAKTKAKTLATRDA
jgi:hypothetical protein